ncbi:acyl-CoA dehydrogenase [Halonotius sp. GCM10025705]|uniref:acyl-CoA dehydrogenase n=1 Tax=Halonotius sp. GCM10025705 TaxID=3252678 RepID=UPI003618D1F2
MSNFKSGSGNLDFGDDDESTESETADEAVPTSSGQKSTKSETDRMTTEPAEESIDESTTSSSADQYPYFVRRSNVGDERDTRLEIHVRDKVADQESAFRNELAEQLDVNEVSKTDAREFALLAAYKHPERVAELMEEEGYGAFG